MENEDKPEKEKSGGIQDKLNKTIDDIRKNEKLEEIYHYATSNTRDTIAYVLLVVALILMLFIPFWGGLLIGLVGGIYFCEELVTWFQDVNQFIETEGFNRCIVIGGIILGFLIAAPAIFIGAAVAIGVRRMIISE